MSIFDDYGLTMSSLVQSLSTGATLDCHLKKTASMTPSANASIHIPMRKGENEASLSELKRRCPRASSCVVDRFSVVPLMLFMMVETLRVGGMGREMGSTVGQQRARTYIPIPWLHDDRSHPWDLMCCAVGGRRR